MLRHGYTAVSEFHYLRNDLDGRPYGVPHEMALQLHGAASNSGIGLTLLPAVYRVADFGAHAPAPEQCRFVTTVEEILTDVEALRQAAAGDGNRRVGLALHSLRAVPPDDLADAVATLHATDPAAPVHIHVAEQLREVRACLAWSGASPVEWLLDHTPVDGSLVRGPCDPYDRRGDPRPGRIGRGGGALSDHRGKPGGRRLPLRELPGRRWSLGNGERLPRQRKPGR